MALTRPGVRARLVLSLAIGCHACSSPSAPDATRYPLTVNPGSLDIASGGRFQFTAQGGEFANDTYTWSLPDGGGTLVSGQNQWQTTLVAGPAAGTYRLVLSTSGGRAAQASFQVYDQFSLEFLSSEPPVGSELLQGTDYITFRWRYVAPGSGSRSIWISFLGGGSPQTGGGGQALVLEGTGIGEAYSRFTATFSCQPCVVETTVVRAEVLAFGGQRLYAAEFPLRYIWK